MNASTSETKPIKQEFSSERTFTKPESKGDEPQGTKAPPYEQQSEPEEDSS